MYLPLSKVPSWTIQRRDASKRLEQKMLWHHGSTLGPLVRGADVLERAIRKKERSMIQVDRKSRGLKAYKERFTAGTGRSFR